MCSTVKTLMVSLFLIVLASVVQARITENYFDAIDMKLFSNIDEMDDSVTNVMTVKFYGLTLTISGKNEFYIHATDSQLLHIIRNPEACIRVEKDKAIPLDYYVDDVLYIKDKKVAEGVLSSFVQGKSIKLRLYTESYTDGQVVDMTNENMGYVYNLAVKRFGWKDLKARNKLQSPKLTVRDRDSRKVTIDDNPYLSLSIQNDFRGKGVFVDYRGLGLVGYTEKGWVFNSFGRRSKKIILRSPDGKVIADYEVPKYSSLDFPLGFPLDKDSTLIKDLLNFPPLTTIEFELYPKRKASLYGLRELYKKGVELKLLPAID